MNHVVVPAQVDAKVSVRVEVKEVLKQLDDDDIRREFERRGMKVDVDVDDILSDLSIEELRRELGNRDMTEIFSGKLRARLELVYEHFRRVGSTPRVLSEYIYDHLGRILP